MTLLQERRTPTRVPEVTSRRSRLTILATVVGLVGLVAAIIGLWMYYAPAAGTMTLLFWEWSIAEMATAWPFSLIIGGSVAVLAASAYGAFRVYDELRSDAYAITLSLLAVASLAVAVFYALVWIF